MGIQMKMNFRKKLGIILGIFILLFFMMPIFYIREIKVTNNRYYSDEEIIKMSGISHGNFLDFSYISATKAIDTLSYIDESHVNYVFPGKIVIDVVENAPFVYVQFKGTYLCLNEQGQVIEQTQKRKHKIPVIEGLKFEAFKSGEVLPILNQDNWLLVIEVIHHLKDHQFEQKVDRIDIHNMEEIHLYVNKLDVIMGGIKDFSKKIDILIKVYEVNDFTIGELTIASDLENNTDGYLCILKPLT